MLALGGGVTGLGIGYALGWFLVTGSAEEHCRAQIGPRSLALPAAWRRGGGWPLDQ
jgi:hypothetical protein